MAPPAGSQTRSGEATKAGGAQGTCCTTCASQVRIQGVVDPTYTQAETERILAAQQVDLTQPSLSLTLSYPSLNFPTSGGDRAEANPLGGEGGSQDPADGGRALGGNCIPYASPCTQLPLVEGLQVRVMARA